MNGHHPPVLGKPAEVKNGPQPETDVRAQTAPGRIGTAWTALTGATGVVMGIAPHVLHHIGPLVGTALVAGAGGTVIFGVVGLAASVPMLARLKRRFRSWWAPAVALGVFAAAFAISTAVIGPAISGTDGQDDEPVPTGSVAPVDHDAHH